ncbi:MAG: hypothetical protein R2734_17925 [Nocardioides sp.]
MGWGLARAGQTRLGAANAVTLTRSVLACGVVALAAQTLGAGAAVDGGRGRRPGAAARPGRRLARPAHRLGHRSGRAPTWRPTRC